MIYLFIGISIFLLVATINLFIAVRELEEAIRFAENHWDDECTDHNRIYQDDFWPEQKPKRGGIYYGDEADE